MKQQKYNQAEQIISPTMTPEFSSDFSRNINQYLHQYITIADAKIFALIGLNATITTLLFPNQPSELWIIIIIRSAVISLAISALIGIIALYPRLPSGRKGLIFWEDILTKKTIAEYQTALQNITYDQVGKEYSQENYHLSKILHQKYEIIRWCVIFFILGFLLVLISKIF